MEAKEWLNGNELSCNIFDKKYRDNGETLDEFFERVSHGYEPVKNLIKEKKFMFGGRILASRGVKDRKVTYSNCYVIAPPEDNLESIFETARKLARTYSYGGGCGVDVSKLAPNGAIVHNAAKTTSGTTSFMDFYSHVTGLIGQSGRRGALMLSIDCSHPDLEDFINLKTQSDICTKANISVRISDAFMKAVENNEDWTMSFYRPESNQTITKTKKARDLFRLLALRNWEWAEPGILYWDRIQNYNLLDNTDFKYAGVNPCAEEPLPAGGSCLLGSINLAEFVKNPFKKTACIDFDALEQAVFVSVVALNQVLIEGLNLHPLEEQRNSVRELRQIGLGTMGLGDMLIKLGIKYGSEESLKIIDTIYKHIATSAIHQSLELAKAHGCYEKCDKEKLVESNFIKNLHLPVAVLDEIKKYGLYNSQLLTCAPTGSIGTMFEISTGVEPNFALSYTRKTQSLDGKDTFYKVHAKIVKDYLEANNLDADSKLPDYFITSGEIDPLDRIKVQGTLQKYIDASISSTINLPKEATVEDVYNIYFNAWKYGLKGVTVYRSGCLREGILTVDNEKKEDNTFKDVKAPKRPKELKADLHLVKARGQQFIVLVGILNNRPYEVWAFRPNMTVKLEPHSGIITKKAKKKYSFKSDLIEIADLQLKNEDIEEKAATLYASMLLRHGVPIKYVVKTSKKVDDNITSFTSAMCRVLNKYITDGETGEKCPECGGELIREGGCIHCKECGWSRCE